MHRLLLALIGVGVVLLNWKVFREIVEERTLLLLNLLMSDLLFEHLDLSLFFLLLGLLPLLFVGKNLFLLIQLFLFLQGHLLLFVLGSGAFLRFLGTFGTLRALFG